MEQLIQCIYEGCTFRNCKFITHIDLYYISNWTKQSSVTGLQFISNFACYQLGLFILDHQMKLCSTDISELSSLEVY